MKIEGFKKFSGKKFEAAIFFPFFEPFMQGF